MYHMFQISLYTMVSRIYVLPVFISSILSTDKDGLGGDIIVYYASGNEMLSLHISYHIRTIKCQASMSTRIREIIRTEYKWAYTAYIVAISGWYSS